MTNHISTEIKEKKKEEMKEDGKRGNNNWLDWIRIF